ncbi:MAG: PIN domain-containing protein [Actinobacteria bacterium]|nr:PIN domain-containing protein [Actinomycetota bacterium]
MKIEFLVDTNVIIYLYDSDNPEKGENAQQLIETVTTRDLALISTQIAGELFCHLNKYLKNAGEIVNLYLDNWKVLEVNSLIIKEAMRAVHQYQLSYWDAQIWATAKLNQIPFIISEDIPGQNPLETATYLDPFTTGFDINKIINFKTST